MTTIIIPAHNEKKNLKRLLSHLDDALLEDVEIVLAISNSTDDGSHNLKIPEYVTLLKCDGCGRALQMNQAVKMATGEVLVFLHADVIPPKDFLFDIKNTIKQGFEAGFFSYRFDKDHFLLKINASMTAKDGIFTGGGDQCLFIKKEVFNTLGGFDEEQVVMEDFEFFERMKKGKIRYKIIKNDLIVSARKYQHNSYARVNLSNLLLVTLFKL